MLWSRKKKFRIEPFVKEADLETVIQEVKLDLFGPSRIYLDIKKRIGRKGKKENIPDGYLIDLSSTVQPSLYVVENELAKHHPLKHVALQILEFSLSYQNSPALVKEILREGLKSSPDDLKRCEKYVSQTQFDNVDHLLDRIVHAQDSSRHWSSSTNWTRTWRRSCETSFSFLWRPLPCDGSLPIGAKESISLIHFWPN